MGCCGGFIGKGISNTFNKVVDIVTDPVNTIKEVGKTIDDIVIQPAIDIVEGGIDLSQNSLQTAGKVTESLVKGDFSDAEQELRGGVNNIDNILSETYMDVRDPLEAAAVIGGNYLLPGSSLVTSQLVSEGAQDILNTEGAQTLNLAAGAGGAYQGNMSNYGFDSTDPNAVGGTTGPDNIDAGGGWSPADGSTASTGSTGTGLTATGGQGLTGGNTANLESMGGAQGVTGPSTSGVTIGETGGTLANGGLGSNIGTTIGSGAAGAAGASGAGGTASTLKTVADAARVGMLVNAIAGDPLGLGGETGGGAGGVSGFGQVGIPAEWKSPTYTYSPVQNLTFEDLFPGVSLQGTQWQGLQNAVPNVTFNDIFASGMQSTPMGTPVDINQIVSSIVGQAAKS